MHRAVTEARDGTTRQRLEIDEVGAIAARDRQPLDVAMCLGHLVAHELQELLGCTGVAQPQRSRMEASDRLIAGHATMRPRRAGIGLVLDQRQSVAIGPQEAQPYLSETLVRLALGGAVGLAHD